MSFRNTYKYLILLFIFFSCSKNQTTLQPPIDIGNVSFIPYTKMKKMEAIYDLGSGSSALGTNFVCKVSKYRVSFFGNGGIFMILKYGLGTERWFFKIFRILQVFPGCTTGTC